MAATPVSVPFVKRVAVSCPKWPIPVARAEPISNRSALEALSGPVVAPLHLHWRTLVHGVCGMLRRNGARAGSQRWKPEKPVVLLTAPRRPQAENSRP